MDPVVGGPTCRGTPDVTALSGDITCCQGTEGNGFYDVEGGTPTGCNSSGAPVSNGPDPCPGTDGADGGTSLSSPLWAGMWARIESSAPSAAGYGFAPPLLYAIGEDQTEDQCAFFDVQITQAATNFGYTALPRTEADPTGWDYVSGLGAPDVTCLITTLQATPAVATPEAPSAALLALGGVVPFAAVAWMRRRRRARRDTTAAV